MSTTVEITGVEVATSIHLIEYYLDQLNKKHTKIAVNSAIQYSEGCPQKEISAKSLKLFGLSSTKWRPCKVFEK